MSEWIEPPRLPYFGKVRIFKGEDPHPFPWVLGIPYFKDGKLCRNYIRYPDWETPWLVAGSIQDKRNRNETF